MGSIADAFAARLAALQCQSEITDRKVAATIARCHQLIAEQAQAEARWADQNAAGGRKPPKGTAQSQEPLARNTPTKAQA